MNTERNTDRYQYLAFISYSRKDEKWAKWLQNKLEIYKLPSSILSESNGNFPKQIGPIFLDSSDIGIGGLQQNLSRELKDSRFLIIISSPNAAKSSWVNLEVENFKSF